MKSARLGDKNPGKCNIREILFQKFFEKCFAYFFAQKKKSQVFTSEAAMRVWRRLAMSGRAALRGWQRGGARSLSSHGRGLSQDIGVVHNCRTKAQLGPVINEIDAGLFASTQYDSGFEKYQIVDAPEALDPTDKYQRTWIYSVNGAGKVIAGSMARLAILQVIASLSASADVLALAATEVDLSKIPKGTNMTVKFRGKPVFVRHRTDEEIAAAEAVDVAQLRDPETDASRVQRPEWLVVLGVCTHLGCVPIANAGNYGGYFCPCHGSHYDTSGRIRRGPAPLNLEIPAYEFAEGNMLIIGTE